MTVGVGIIADDLTGALDAAAPFAGRGLRTKVVVSPDFWQPEALAGAEVVCINTASREIDAIDAGLRVTRACERLLSLAPAVVFKKVDSRLKGNLASELDAMLAATGRSRIVLAPAIPDLGRVSMAGYVRGLGLPQPVDMLALCGSLPVVVPDTADNNDLESVADAAVEAADTTLLAGARGLALAVAQRFPVRPVETLAVPVPQPTLIAIGSRDAITRAQIDHLSLSLSLQWLRAPNGDVPAASPASLTLVTAEPGERPEPSAAVAERFADGLARLVRRHIPSTMLLSGGETAYALLRRLGVATVDLGGEALPGIPFFRTLIGDRQVVILTKSGGFGPPDTISLLVSMHMQSHSYPENHREDRSSFDEGGG